MARKYSLAYLTIPGTDPVTQIRIAAETGYDFVSLRTIPMHLPGEPAFLPDKDPQLFADIREALVSCGVGLHDIELARVREDLDISSYEAAFETAARLGAKDVLGSVWTRDRPFYTETVGKICEMAALYGLCYNVEFLPWAGVRSLQEAVTLIEDLRCKNLFIMLDTLHAGRAGVTPEEIRRTDPSYFRFLHICDGPAGPDGDPVLGNIKDPLMLTVAREARLYPGEGVMDIAGMAAALPKTDLVIELPNLARIGEYGAKEHARRCIEAAKACILTA